jgi:serine phosphatase RsbU (regulator of sigma subunit)
MSYVQSATAPPADTIADPEPPSPAPALSPASPRWWSWVPVATLVIGLVVTLALVLVSHAQYTSNEKRLLKLRVHDAGALVTAAVPSTVTPLASAAELADATNGNVAKFKTLVMPYGGAARQFASISLWKLSALNAGPVAVVGVAPKLAASPSTAATFLAKAARTPELSVTGLLSAPDPRLGYAYATPGGSGDYVVYAESPLPANRRSKLQSRSAFTNLDYAIYLGAGQHPAQLLVTNRTRFPLPSPSVAETLAFGNNDLTVAMSSRVPLAGSLPQNLPWIIAVVGTLLSAAAAFMTLRLTQRRRNAEQLAGELDVSARENRRLYAEQRGIAQTLQHALLPDRLPEIPGMEASARYEAGEQGVEIGGDWYDVIALDDSRVLLVVGDVSGRGLPAATTMASLRFAIRAYAAQNDPPEQILTKASRLVDVAESGQLATVLCALVDVEGHQLTITSAGHLPGLLLSGDQGRYVDAEVGVPIGVERGATYTSTTISVPPGSTFVAYTDGLVELRGESLDQGLARLRELAIRRDGGLPELLGALVSEMPRGASEDDIAIVGVRWTS